MFSFTRKRPNTPDSRPAWNSWWNQRRATQSTDDREDTWQKNGLIRISGLPPNSNVESAVVVDGQTADATGGLSSCASIAWTFKGSTIHVWRYSEAFRHSAIKFPPSLAQLDGGAIVCTNWMVTYVEELPIGSDTALAASVSMVAVHKPTMATCYWPDVFSSDQVVGVTGYKGVSLPGRVSGRKQQDLVTAVVAVNTSPAAEVRDSMEESSEGSTAGCTLLVGRESGEVWRLECDSNGGVRRSELQRVSPSAAVRAILLLPTVLNSSSSNSNSSMWNPSKEAVSSPHQSSDAPYSGGAGSRGRWKKKKIKEEQRGPALWCHSPASCYFLVLTRSALQGWTLAGSTVALSWTYELLTDKDILADMGGQKQVVLVDACVVGSPSAHAVSVLLSSVSKDSSIVGSYHSHYWLMQFRLPALPPVHAGGLPAEAGSVQLERYGFTQPIVLNGRSQDPMELKLHIGGTPPGSAVVLAPSGTATLALFDQAETGLCHVDPSWQTGRVLAVGVLASAGRREAPLASWLVLTERGGVLAIPDSWHGSGQGSASAIHGKRQRLLEVPAGATAGSRAVQSSQVESDSQSIVAEYFEQYLVSGSGGREVADALKRAHAFADEADASLFSVASCRLVDSLSQQWNASISSPLLRFTSSLVAASQRKHQLYLTFLEASGCLAEITATRPSVLECILEHGEKLAAMAAILNFYSSRCQPLPETQPPPWQLAAPPSSPLDSSVGPSAVWQAILLCRDNHGFLTSQLQNLFAILPDSLPNIVGRGAAEVQLARLCCLVDCLTGALQEACRYKEDHASLYARIHAPGGSGFFMPWLTLPAVHQGLWALTLSCIHMRSQLAGQPVAGDVADRLFTVGQQLLDLSAESLAGMEAVQGEQWAQYVRMRDQFFDGVAAMAPIERGREEQLLSLAEKHRAYQFMMDGCQMAGQEDRMKGYLKDVSFCQHVFDRLHQAGQYRSLLQLGQDVPDALEAFLEGHVGLQWLHKICLKKYRAAATTLHQLAVSNDVKPHCLLFPARPPAASEGLLELSRRRQLLSLARLADLADPTASSSQFQQQVDSDMRLIDIQASWPAQYSDRGSRLLPARQTMEVCIQGTRRMLMQAFSLFASSSVDTQLQLLDLVRAAWCRAADMDTWHTRLLALGVEQDESNDLLKETCVFEAVQICYASSLVVDSVLPLFDEVAGSGAHNCVENILRRHIGIPSAGLALKTTLKLASGQLL